MKVNKVLKYYFLISILLGALTGFSQGDYRFNNYTISNGLSQSFVTTIIQDQNNSLWIGTQDGLNRFDGKAFEVFNQDETPGLESSNFQCSVRTPDGRLWFGTASGLILFDPNSERFTTFNINSQILLDIQSVDFDQEGNLWLATVGYGVVKFDTRKLKFETGKVNLVSKKVHLVKCLQDGNLLIDIEDKGLVYFNLKAKSGQKLTLKSKNTTLVSILKMLELDNGMVILCTNQGLYQFNPKLFNVTIKFKSLDKLGLFSIKDLVFSNGKYFIATTSNGLFTINESGSIFNSTEDLFQKNSLLFNGLSCLFQDNNNKIWVGSERGLSGFDPNRIGFLGIGPSGNLKKGLPSPNVWCFSEDPSAKFVFIGTDAGVSRFNRKTGVFDQFKRSVSSYTNSETGKEVVLSIFSISENRVLVGCLDGLYELQINGPQNFVYRKLTYVPKNHAQKHDRVYSIVPFKKNQFFLATKGGVIRYDLLKNKSELFEHNPKDKKNSISIGVCRVAYKDKVGKFWFATSGGGLNYFSESKQKIVPHPINSVFIRYVKDYVSTICHIKGNEYWLGTFGSGLVQINLKSNSIKIVGKKQGLPNNVIYGLLEDSYNRLWLSTNRGIASYNRKTGVVNIYKEVNGLVSNEFNSNAFYQSRKGELFFGGINGYNYFFPGNLSKSSGDLEVIISKFRLDKNWLKPGDKDSPLKTVISKTNALKLDYKHRSFTIRFQTNDISNPQLVNYKYILEGSDVGEQLIGTDNELSFNSLSPGEYTLKIYARLGDGSWSKRPANLLLVINSPYWATWWFWLIAAFLLSVLTLIIFRRRIDFARREQVRLELKIAERTREIRQQKTQIEEANKVIEAEKNKVLEQQELLQIEKDKVEKWLSNTLPAEAVIELKRSGKVQAHSFKVVSVLFTDVVGFTKISETMSANRLVNKLDVLFRKFDEIIENNNLEKIKTIGDAYMCAGGIPTENSTNAIDACTAAIQIQDYMSKIKFDAIANHEDFWEIRLGINTGPVTAGIIGNLRLAYDVWGSTVNLAQRMEMLSQPGKVTITGSTFNYIEPFFECDFKGRVQSKAKTMVDMYEVIRIKPELSVNGEGLVPNIRFEEIKKLHHYSTIKYYKTEHQVLKVLEKGLSEKLYYHSITHTKDVVKSVERIALLEGVTDEGLFLLKTAAILHDAGFIERYEHNEEIGARMAREILPKYGYTEQHIKTIVELIHVTEIPHRPINKLQEIICDADLDYLGRDDFEEIADRLRKELREMNKIDSDRKWDEIQIKFLENHNYFTQTAIELRQKKKESNIQLVRDRLERNEYQD
jgi:ligand-binding sensor domain-containing protein/class 3 adenylate cyclase